MRTMRFISLLLIATCAVGAAYASEPQSNLYWNLEFGVAERAPALRYGFSLRQPVEHIRDLPLPPLANLDFNGSGARASLAGVPLWQRSYRLSQDARSEELEDQQVVASETSTTWFGGTTGTILASAVVGVAVLCAAADDCSVGDDEPSDNRGNTNSGDGCAGPSGNIGPYEIPCVTPSEDTACVNGICVFCGNGDVASDCESDFVSRRVAILNEPRSLDANSGYMGDLFPRSN